MNDIAINLRLNMATEWMLLSDSDDEVMPVAARRLIVSLVR